MSEIKYASHRHRKALHETRANAHNFSSKSCNPDLYGFEATFIDKMRALVLCFVVVAIKHSNQKKFATYHLCFLKTRTLFSLNLQYDLKKHFQTWFQVTTQNVFVEVKNTNIKGTFALYCIKSPLPLCTETSNVPSTSYVREYA